MKRSRSGSILKVVSPALSCGRRGGRNPSLSTPEEASSRGSSRTGETRVQRENPTTSRPMFPEESYTRLSSSDLLLPKPVSRIGNSYVELDKASLTDSRVRPRNEGHFGQHETPTQSITATSNVSSKNTSQSRRPRRPESAVPNFSYKSSPLLPPTSNLQDVTASEHCDKWYQPLVAQIGASKVARHFKDASSPRSRYGNSEIGSPVGLSVTDRPTEQSVDCREPGTSSSMHQPASLDKSPFNVIASGATHSRGSRHSLHAALVDPGWNSLGIFDKAPNFGETSNLHASDLCYDQAFQIASTKRSDSESSSNGNKPKKIFHDRARDEGFGISVQAPGFSGASQSKSHEKCSVENKISEINQTWQGSDKLDSARDSNLEDLYDNFGVFEAAPNFDDTGDITRPDPSESRKGSGHPGSSTKKSSAGSKSEHAASRPNSNDHGAFQTRPHTGGSPSVAPISNAFCS